MHRSSLQSKLAVAMWLITAVSILTAALLSGSLLIRSHRESIRKQLQATGASLLSMGLSDFSELKDFENLNNFIEDALQMDKADKSIRVYDHSERLIFTTLGAAYDGLPDLLKERISKPKFITMEGKGQSYESLIIPYEGKGRQKQFFLQVVMPLPKYSEMLEELWWQLILLLALLVGISMMISRFVAARLLAPVAAVADYLQKLDPEKIDEWRQLNVGSHGHYLKSIIDGVNLLCTRTREAIMQLSKMSRYVAHELRTPLTILQGEAEMTLLKKEAANDEYRQVLTSSLEEVKRMSEIVDTVLKVGERARSITLFNPKNFDLAEWSSKNMSQWEKTLGRPIKFDTSSKSSIKVYADPDLLYRLVDNLIRNVKEHTPAHAACSLDLEQSRGCGALIVTDGGPGLRPDIIASLNHDGSSSEAAGIGLNLCLKIADICGLGLRFSNIETGGLKVKLSFPQPLQQ